MRTEIFKVIIPPYQVIVLEWGDGQTHARFQIRLSLVCWQRPISHIFGSCRCVCSACAPIAAVRLSWGGTKAVNLPAPVRYFSLDEGGVSHFRYLRDNVLLTWMHTRLFFGFLLRLPLLLVRKARER